MTPLTVGILHDERFLLHQTGLDHPERPGRLKAISRMLEKEFPEGLVHIKAEPATLEQLELVHTPQYIMKVLKTSERELTHLAPDTPAGAQSYLAAWLAVGGCIRALRSLVSGRCDACLCLVRPPGHHAQPDRAGGYCIFNNLGITARLAIEHLGIRRILLIDWDITHGQALQEVFYDRTEVLYLSTHYNGRHPFTGEWDETGSDDGLGYTVNIPVPKEIEDADLLYLYARVLPPIMRTYRPELILVAAGFNGHHRDPVGRTKLTEEAFGLLTELLLAVRDPVRSPPLLFALEGGYDVAALAECVKEVLAVLTFKGRRRTVPVSFTPIGSELSKKAFDIHRKYHVWID